MTPFTRISALAVPMAEANIDTDIIVPARFLLITDKQGLGRAAFFERRYDPEGAPRPGFVLNDPRYAGAQILIAGANFGCGSSREQAVWALAELGFRCVIASSFGEIFAANCARNGLLTIALDEARVARLMGEAAALRPFTVDLHACTIRTADADIPFAIADSRRRALLEGLDEPAMILADHHAAIAAFEREQRATQPWLWRNDNGQADRPRET